MEVEKSKRSLPERLEDGLFTYGLLVVRPSVVAQSSSHRVATYISGELREKVTSSSEESRKEGFTSRLD